jgi:hypothetical protein
LFESDRRGNLVHMPSPGQERQSPVWRVRVWSEYERDDGKLLDDRCASRAEAETLAVERARELGSDYTWNVFLQPTTTRMGES